MFVHVALLLTLGMLLTAVLIIAFWAMFGPPSTASDRLDLVKVALIVVGGTGGVVALTVAYRKQRQSEETDQREQYKLFTDRYVKATEQLGHDKPAVRAAGVYAMAELADDWAEGRQLCIDVLCAYIRMPYRDPEDGEREVRRTLFRIIRNHLRPEARWSRVKWFHHRFSFEGATIDSGDLSGCHIAAGGHMTFHGVRFTDGFLLSHLTLHDGAPMWFTNARFEGRYCSFKNSDFRGSKVEFDRAEFASGLTTFKGVRCDAVEDRNAEWIETGITRIDTRCTGGTVDWGDLPSLPVTAENP
ncbi:MAG TPA: hypothetical protein VGX25_16530 [Actinophytocola sp.]|uniref:hypothetical protein n=1 Tax=Actinophytocola sp. TaxID=1872138 RepID=UPI002DDD6F4D|nr:hypothetical protein [Actinophytocola sp.]HEV2780992.1 hypothetical protein [Actinophytocola sp.]